MNKLDSELIAACVGSEEAYRAPIVMGYLEEIQRLLNAKANVNTCTPSGLTPIKTAILYDDPYLLDILLARPLVNVNQRVVEPALHVACRLHRVRAIDSLLEKRADPFLLDTNGQTALHRLCVNSWSIDIVPAFETLMTHGAGPTLFVLDKNKKTPMDLAPLVSPTLETAMLSHARQLRQRYHEILDAVLLVSNLSRLVVSFVG